MDGFKAQFERVKQQLAALSSTQRMLVMALAAVMALTLLYWGKYAGTPELTPVVAGAFSDDEMARADAALTSAGVAHSAAAGRLMVPVDRRSDAYAALAMAAALPSDARPAAVDAAATGDGDANPFASNAEREAHGVRQLQGILGDVIRRFPGVANATVVVNAKQEYHIGGTLAPSAVVNIASKSPAGLPDVKNIARAAAETVGRSVSGLSLDQVSVIVNGRTVRFPGVGGDASDFLDQQRAQEEACDQKLERTLGHIRGVTIAVTCSVDARSTSTQTTSYDPKGIVSSPAQVHDHSEETQTTEAHTAEPGFAPNTGQSGGGGSGGASVDAGTGGGGAVVPGVSRSEVTDNDTKNFVAVGTTSTNSSQQAGTVSLKSVAIGVPHKYFVDVYKLYHAGVKDVSEETLAPFVTEQSAVIAKLAKNAVGMPAEDGLSVAMYPDLPDGDGVLPTGGTAGVGDGVVAQLMSGHAKEVAAGGLALVSLMMMLGIARKSNPAVTAFAGLPAGGQAGVGDGEDPRDVLLASEEDVAGSAVAGDAPLDGMELDDEAIRSQQMLDQVSTLVKENPDAAAALVKRWVSRA